jgi:hypothetical protein
MSTFLTIPQEEIEKFLRYYQLEIPEDPDVAYGLVWDYIMDHPNLYLPSIYLEDFMLAYNHQDQLEESQKTSSILMTPETDLTTLAASLGLARVDKERILRILGYLNLLDNDESLFDHLPEDTLRIIGMRLDCQSLGLFCQISRRFNQLFCQTDKLTAMLRLKLGEITGLDLAQYTRKELGLLCRVGNRNNRIAAGSAHSLILDSQGQVFGFGLNDDGQLGLGDIINRNVPTLIDNISIGQIISVSCGGNHSLLLNSQGQVFSFGDKGAVLGLGSSKIKGFPMFIKTKKIGKIIAISAGNNHSLLLNSHGQVFSFGIGHNGKLGLGDTKTRNTPTLINTTLIGEIISISAG